MFQKRCYVIMGLLVCCLYVTACGNGRQALPRAASTNANDNLQPVSSQNATSSMQNNQPSSITVQLDGVSYVIPLHDERTKKFNYAVKSSAGIVWVPAPKMNIVSGTESNPIFFPVEPFTFYLSALNEKKLDVRKSEKLLTLPLKDGEANILLNNVFAVGDYIIYHTSSDFTDGAQPLREQAWVMSVGNPASNKEILTFHSSGGYFYHFAVDEKEGLYISVSTIPGNEDGSNSYEVYVYNISTGKKEKIERYSLNTQLLDTVQFDYNGKKLSYKLQSK